MKKYNIIAACLFLVLSISQLNSYSQNAEEFKNISNDEKILMHINEIVDTLKARNEYEKDRPVSDFRKLIFIEKVLDVNFKCGSFFIIKFGRLGDDNDILTAIIIENEIYFIKDSIVSIKGKTKCEVEIISQIDDLLKLYEKLYY